MPIDPYMYVYVYTYIYGSIYMIKQTGYIVFEKIAMYIIHCNEMKIINLKKDLGYIAFIFSE